MMAGNLETIILSQSFALKDQETVTVLSTLSKEGVHHCPPRLYFKFIPSLLKLGYFFVTRIIAQEARVIQVTDVK